MHVKVMAMFSTHCLIIQGTMLVCIQEPCPILSERMWMTKLNLGVKMRGPTWPARNQGLKIQKYISLKMQSICMPVEKTQFANIRLFVSTSPTAICTCIVQCILGYVQLPNTQMGLYREAFRWESIYLPGCESWLLPLASKGGERMYWCILTRH